MSRTTLMFAAAIVLSVAAGRVDAQQLADEHARHDAVEFYRAGQQLMAGEKFAEAADQFQKAIGKDALYTLAHYSLGQAYMNLRDYPKAIAAFQGCIEASRQLFALAETNRFAVEKQRDDDMREARETIRTLQAKGQTLLATRAEQHLQDLEHQKTSVNGAFRPPAEVLLSLGSAHFRAGDAASAESAWKAALDVNPKLAEAHNNLAVVYMLANRFTEADAQVKAAEKGGFKVNPQFKEDLKKRAAEAAKAQR